MAKTIKLKFNKRRPRGLSGNQLKMIACFLMLCDSVGFVLIENGVLYGYDPIYWNLALATELGRRWYMAARVLRFFGRMAFPIFAYMVAEGFIHTENERRYIFRMLLLAIVSEAPFDLATAGVLYSTDYQNVCFTYALSLMALYIIKKLRKRWIILRFLMIAIFAALAYYLRSDYGPLGVVFICFMYLLRQDRAAKLVLGALISAVESLVYYCVSALSFILIKFYNGKRGDMPLKYFFYIIYPVHLLLFYLLVYIANR